MQTTVAAIIPEEVGEFSYTDYYVNFHQKRCYYKIGPALKKNLISVLRNHFENVQIFESSLTQIPESCNVIFVPSIEEFSASRFTGSFTNSEVRMILRLKAFSRSQETLWAEDFYGESSAKIGWNLEKRIQEQTQVTQQ